MEIPPSRLPFTRALRHGLAQAVSLAPASLALWGARAISGAAVTLAGWAMLAALLHEDWPLALAGVGGLLLLALVAELLAGPVIAGALRQGASRSRRLPVPGLLDAVLAQARAGLTYPLWAAAILALASLWRWTALWAGTWLYVRALSGDAGGVTGAAALALALVLGFPLALLAQTWVRTALVEAVHRERSMGVALYEAVGLLRQRLWAPLGLIAVTELAAGLGAAIAGGLLRPFGMGGGLTGETLLLAFLVPLCVGLLGALPSALFEHGGWQSLLALRLDAAGELPPEAPPRRMPPRPAPPIEAEPVVTAEPIVDAELIPSGH